jgi:D-alanyl-D-alanine carboxypeptidase
VTAAAKEKSKFFKLLTLATMAFCVVALVLAAPAEAAKSKKKHAAKKPSGANPRYAALVIDADTGTILHQSNADKTLHPASLTKMMTLYMVFEALQRGDFTLRDRIVISKHAASAAPSKIGIPAGQSIRVEDAIYAVVTKSANDMAAALGEKVGGSESRFAEMMTLRAHQIGMSKTKFRNASGLHNPQQVTSARDMAKLAQRILTDYPQYYHYFSTKNFTYRGVSYHNHNRLMDSYKGMDGFKTGYIGPSGFNLVASAVRKNHRLIGVVFGGRSAASRNARMAELLDDGFARYDEVMVASRDVPRPLRKPEQPMAVVVPSAEALADLDPALQEDRIGEGDFEPSPSGRMESGMIAINAVRGSAAASSSSVTASSPVQKGMVLGVLPAVPSAAPPVPVFTPSRQTWAVQIGAYNSRVKTDEALGRALSALPDNLSAATAQIVPLRTQQGMIFRGRLGGFADRAEAETACRYIGSCVPISPQAY